MTSFIGARQISEKAPELTVWVGFDFRAFDLGAQVLKPVQFCRAYPVIFSIAPKLDRVSASAHGHPRIEQACAQAFPNALTSSLSSVTWNDRAMV